MSSSDPGSAQGQGSNSVSGMVSTLVPSFLIACALVGCFLVLRTKVQRIYAPRTYLGVLSEHQKSPRQSPTRFGWISEFLSIEDEYVLSHHSLDAYLFLRFWKRLFIICALAWPLTWIVLMPVYGTAHGTEQQFDKISFSNIDASRDSNRLYATAFVAWLVLGGTMYFIGRESLFALNLKQAFLTAPGIASRIASRTVLFTGLPTSSVNNERAIRELFPAVKAVWFVRDTKELDELVEERDKVSYKLEGAVVKMSKLATKRTRKNNEKAKKSGDSEKQEDVVHWLDENKRPTHRLKPLIGKKVDTVTWCQDQLQYLIPRVQKNQEAQRSGDAKFMPSVFIEFETVEAAQAAVHTHKVGGKTEYIPRATGMRPYEVIWKNLSMGLAQNKIRNAVVIAIICAMIIFWLPIVAFIGALSNINSLTDRVKFLSFINDIPGPILGIVTGLIPVVLLAVLMALVPIIMRLLFKLAGAATLSEVELKTQTWYFVFQVIQVFLITTIASGAASTVTDIIRQPASAPNLLAANLPKASNFYINFFVLYGLAVAAQSLFNIVAVALYLILGKFLDSTPRKMFKRYTSIAGLGWGSVYPKFTNLGVIALTYSCISPLILAFATISFFLLGVAYRYSLIYSIDTTLTDTHGANYLKALQQLTTGVYLAEICLIGLMGISAGSSTAATGPLVITIILLAVTIVYHILLNRALSSMNKQLAENFESRPTSGETEDGPKVTAQVTGKAAAKNAALFTKILRPSSLPVLAPYLATPMPAYTEEERSEAYLNPALSSEAPLMWIVRDNVGISAREKQAIEGKNLSVTDEGAWWDDSGKLMTVWKSKDESESKDILRATPIWEKIVHY